MSSKPVLALSAAALFLLLAGCEYAKPPAQLEALLTLEPGAGDQSDKVQLRALADSIVGYLGLAGIDSKNARVRFDEAKKAYYFEVYGKQPVPKALLDQVAKGLNPLDKDRSWPAKVEVAPLDHLDTLLGSKERNFPVRASWKDAQIDAYVVRAPDLGYAMPTLDPTGAPKSAPKTALCMLSFKPEPALPKLEGTMEEFYGKSDDNDPHAQLRRRVMADRVLSAPHQVTFDEPELAKAFKEGAMAKDGKLMFQFAVLEDVNVLDFAGSKTAPMDLGGHTKQQCQSELIKHYPALSKIMDKVALLEHVKAFGPARMIALPLAGK